MVCNISYLFIYLSVSNKGRCSHWTNSCKPLVINLITILDNHNDDLDDLDLDDDHDANDNHDNDNKDDQRLPIHMGRSMVGEHASIRDPCLVDAIQVNAVLADNLQIMMMSMISMMVMMMMMSMMRMIIMLMRSNVSLFVLHALKYVEGWVERISEVSEKILKS